MTRPRLGKGLDVLIPQTARTSGQAIATVDADLIDSNPSQPRINFDDKALADLSASIKQHGILQPLVVSQIKNRYQLIAGERRLQAAKQAGLRQVPVITRDTDKQDRLELALIENVQRENLNPLEEAQAYHKLKTEFDLSLKQISVQVGKNISTISNKTRLLELPQIVQDGLLQDKISEGHARALLGLEQPELMQIAYAQIVKQDLSVRQVEQLVRSRTNQTKAKSKKSKRSNKWASLESDMQSSLGTKVRIRESSGKGQIIIEFYALEELKELTAKIKK